MAAGKIVLGCAAVLAASLLFLVGVAILARSERQEAEEERRAFELSYAPHLAARNAL